MILVISDAAIYMWLSIILVCASLAAHNGDYEPLEIMLAAFVSMMTALASIPFYMQTAIFALVLVIVSLVITLATAFID